MATFIIILFVLGGYHFILDGIIAPSVRLSIRYKLFKLRDELRRIKIEKDKELDDEIFELSDVAFSRSIHSLPTITLGSIIRTQMEIAKDSKLKKEVDQRIQKIQSCKIERVKELNALGVDYTSRALLVNMWGWMIYLIPVVILLVVLAQITRVIKRVNKNVQALTYSPDKEFEKIDSQNAAMTW